MSGKLFIVATPIGNLKDITLRAIETLKSVDLIACEDTRHTHILLDEYSIGTQTAAYHKFNIRQKTKYIIDQLLSGRNIALVSDAGSPGISDPGEELIKASIDAGIRIEAIPGPTALITALSVSGSRTDRFIFEGFLPARSAQRRSRLKILSTDDRTIILYEAPHRLIATLEDIKAYLGDRKITVARELTKKFEEINRGQVSDMIRRFNGSKPKGEMVIIIEGKGEQEEPEEKRVKEAKKLIKEMEKEGLSISRAVRIASRSLDVPRNELYRESIKK